MESGWACEVFFMESPQFNTSSIRDKLHRWKSLPSSERRIFNNISTMRTRWKVVVRLYGMLLLSAKCPGPLDRWENAIRKAIWRTIQRPIILFGAVVEHCLSSPKDQAIIHQFCQKVSPGIFLGYRLIAGRIWKGEILIAYLEDLEKLDASDTCLRTSTMNFEFNSTCLWKKHSLFHWNVLMLRGLLTLIWMCCKKRRLAIIGMSIEQAFVRFLERIYKVHFFWKRSFQEDTFGLGETDKNSDDYQTRFLYGQKNGRKLVKPFTIEKNNKIGKKIKNLTMLGDWEDFILLTQMTENIQKFSKNTRRK